MCSNIGMGLGINLQKVSAITLATGSVEQQAGSSLVNDYFQYLVVNEVSIVVIVDVPVTINRIRGCI